MAATALRLRRTLALSSTILHHSKHTPSIIPPPSTSSPYTIHQNPSLCDVTRSKSNASSFHFVYSRSFSSRSRFNNDGFDGDQIGPDDILFEGCDYNHWLITMDFPKDPNPSPEEMVETYVQTAAKVLGSVEEAKKKIYACSTTTYNGFQVEVSEEVSEKFKSIPGVVFVLPDSYIDPVNKEYGGDKYINGTIIPRPPPVQFGRQGGRFNDRNREYNRPQRGQYDQNNAPGGPGNYQRGPMPSNQGNYNQGEGRTFSPRDQGNYGQRDFRGQGGNSTPPPPGGSYNQGGGGGYRQGTGGQYDQGRGGQYGQGGGGGGYGQSAGGQYGQMSSGNYGQGTGGQYGQGGGGYGQGTGGQYGQGGGGGYGQYGPGSGGNYGQGNGGNYGNGTGGQYGQGTGYSGNQTSSQYGENPNFSQAGQRGNIGGQQGNYEVAEEAEAFKGR